MHSDSHFYPATTPQSSQVTIWVNQHPLTVPASWSIAAALLANGHLITRHSMLDEQPRGPYCMMGVCFECRLTVNGVRNVQACMTPVQEGMQIITSPTAESS